MIKKLPFTLFLLTFAFFVNSFAQTDAPTEKQQAIKELVTLINADNKAEELVNVITAQLEQLEDATIKTMLDERTDLTAADRKAVEEILLTDKKESSKRFQAKLMQKLDYTAIIIEISAIVYDKNFTLEEIRDLTAFYRTATGQKSLKMMSPIMTDTMQLLSERLLPKIPVIIKEIEQENRLEIEQKINARKPKPKNKKSE